MEAADGSRQKVQGRLLRSFGYTVQERMFESSAVAQANSLTLRAVVTRRLVQA